MGFWTLHRWLGWLRSAVGVFVFFVPILAHFPTIKVKQAAPWLLASVVWSDRWLWVAVPSGVVLATALKFVRKQLVDPEIYAALQELLDHLHGQMFPDARDESSRLTLFRFSRFCLVKWPWMPKKGGWLVPVMRSNEMHKDFKLRFKVTADPATSEGVAGRAWCELADVIVPNLPDVRRNLNRAPQYAKLTNMSEKWVRDHHPKSRSFYAIKVKSKTKKWGVVVIDSTQREMDYQLIAEIFRHTQRFLSLYAAKV